MVLRYAYLCLLSFADEAGVVLCPRGNVPDAIWTEFVPMAIQAAKHGRRWLSKHKVTQQLAVMYPGYVWFGDKNVDGVNFAIVVSRTLPLFDTRLSFSEQLERTGVTRGTTTLRVLDWLCQPSCPDSYHLWRSVLWYALHAADHALLAFFVHQVSMYDTRPTTRALTSYAVAIRDWTSLSILVAGLPWFGNGLPDHLRGFDDRLVEIALQKPNYVPCDAVRKSGLCATHRAPDGTWIGVSACGAGAWDLFSWAATDEHVVLNRMFKLGHVDMWRKAVSTTTDCRYWHTFLCWQENRPIACRAIYENAFFEGAFSLVLGMLGAGYRLVLESTPANVTCSAANEHAALKFCIAVGAILPILGRAFADAVAIAKMPHGVLQCAGYGEPPCAELPLEFDCNKTTALMLFTRHALYGLCRLTSRVQKLAIVGCDGASCAMGVLAIVADGMREGHLPVLDDLLVAGLPLGQTAVEETFEDVTYLATRLRRLVVTDCILGGHYCACQRFAAALLAPESRVQIMGLTKCVADSSVRRDMVPTSSIVRVEWLFEGTWRQDVDGRRLREPVGAPLWAGAVARNQVRVESWWHPTRHRLYALATRKRILELLYIARARPNARRLLGRPKPPVAIRVLGILNAFAALPNEMLWEIWKCIARL